MPQASGLGEECIQIQRNENPRTLNDHLSYSFTGRGWRQRNFSCFFLASLEERLNNPIGNYFDLIAGTSTGGILALGLGLGFSAKRLLKFYETLGQQVFGGSRVVRFLKQFGFSKYSQKPLRVALESKFGNRKIGNSRTRLVIPSLNLETGEVHVFKTAHHPRLEMDYKKLAIEAALATAAAPTFFPTYRSTAGIPLVDGGMWANNPVGFVVVEALGVLGWDKDKLRILSIGCTRSPLDVGLGRHFGLGKFYWCQKVVDIFMSGQSSASLGTAQLLAGHKNVFRIDPVVPPRRFGLDVLREIGSLRGLGESEARKALPLLKPIFFQKPAEEFVPYYRIIVEPSDVDRQADKWQQISQ
jgi:hypothetical protein